MALVTRLGLHGTSAAPYGSFAGKMGISPTGTGSVAIVIRRTGPRVRENFDGETTSATIRILASSWRIGFAPVKKLQLKVRKLTLKVWRSP